MNNDQLLFMLLSVRDGRTMTEMKQVVKRSIRIIYLWLQDMEESNLIEREKIEGGRKTRNRGNHLTDAGKEYLKNYGHSTEPSKS